MFDINLCSFHLKSPATCQFLPDFLIQPHQTVIINWSGTHFSSLFLTVTLHNLNDCIIHANYVCAKMLSEFSRDSCVWGQQLFDPWPASHVADWGEDARPSPHVRTGKMRDRGRCATVHSKIVCKSTFGAHVSPAAIVFISGLTNNYDYSILEVKACHHI